MAGRNKYLEHWVLDAPVTEAADSWSPGGGSGGDYIFFLVNSSQPTKDANGNILAPATPVEISFNTPFGAGVDKTLVLQPGEALNEVPLRVKTLHYRATTATPGRIRALLLQE